MISCQTLNIVYNQYLHHFRKIQRNICPYQAFCDDLIQFITQSIQASNKIILCIDMNECVFNEKLQRMLNGLGLIEVSSQFSREIPLPLHIIELT